MILIIVLGLIGKWLDVSQTALISIYVLLVIFLTNYYRIRNFKMIDTGKANFLSMLVTGLGQVYSRYTKFGLTLIVLHFILYFGAMMEQNDFGRFLLIGWVTLTVISVIHTNLMARGVNSKLSKEAFQKLAVLKYRKLIPAIEQGSVFAPDTNVLMHEQLTLVAAFYDSNVKLYISKQVLKELDGLKKNDSPKTRKSAQLAFDLLELYQGADRIVFINVPGYKFLQKHNLTDGPDEKIIASCLQQLYEYRRPVVFLSNDKGARLLAKNSGLPILKV